MYDALLFGEWRGEGEIEKWQSAIFCVMYYLNGSWIFLDIIFVIALLVTFL